jgi:hypothetical protein
MEIEVAWLGSEGMVDRWVLMHRFGSPHSEKRNWSSWSNGSGFEIYSSGEKCKWYQRNANVHPCACAMRLPDH